MTQGRYTTQMRAGLGMVDETRALLDLWTPGMKPMQLYRVALDSGSFPALSARSLRNLINDCFSPRFLVSEDSPAEYLKLMLPVLVARELEQFLLVYTCRANAILADFIRQVYWPAYTAGRESMTNQEAREFVLKANQQGLTAKPWSATTVKRVSSYLTGACADFGLLERGRKSTRKLLACHLEPKAAIILAYDLHFSGLGDNAIISHPTWELFGLERCEVIAEIRRLSLQGFFLIQTAGDIVSIAWQCKNAKELSSAISKR